VVLENFLRENKNKHTQTNKHTYSVHANQILPQVFQVAVSKVELVNFLREVLTQGNFHSNHKELAMRKRSHD
jgi:hypothetical protein